MPQPRLPPPHAAVPAIISTTATATEQDPIFALIEQHKAAMAEYVRLVDIKSAIPNTDESEKAYELLDDAQTALLTTRPTTLAGAAAVLIYVTSFWIEGDDSSAKGLPVYEPLTLAHDHIPSVGDGFLPMIADALQRMTAV